MGVYTNILESEKKDIISLYNLKISKIFKIEKGILNSNFLILSGREKFILRIFEADRNKEEEEQEFFFLEKLAKDIPVSLPVKNILGDYISIINGKKIALFNYIEGENLENVNIYFLKKIAEFLAKIHKISLQENISQKNYSRNSRIDLNLYLNNFYKININILEKEFICQELEKIKNIDFSHLPSGIVHGDIFPDNILIKNKEIKAIIDFNESYFAPFIYDIAIIINFWIKNNKLSESEEKEWTKIFIEEYSKIRKIEDIEFNYLNLALKKICLTFILLRLERENTYDTAIKIEKKSYIPLLNLLKKLG